MKLVLALALTLALCTPVLADPLPATSTVVNTTSATTAKTGPGIFYGVDSTAIQTTVVTCFDNTAASGKILWTGTPTPTAPAIGIPGPGIAFVIGLTCQIATSVVAPGYMILWN